MIQSRRGHFFSAAARMRLFFGLCSTSASPSASGTGGTYIPKRPRNPFFKPYQPFTGFVVARPHASTVPSAEDWREQSRVSAGRAGDSNHADAFVKRMRVVSFETSSYVASTSMSQTISSAGTPTISLTMRGPPFS